MKYVENLKKMFQGPRSQPYGFTPEDIDLGLEKSYLMTSQDQKLGLWMKFNQI